MIYIFWTCADKTEATTIIYALLEQRLIACASILDNVTSIYRWEGKIEECNECKIIIKTVPQHFNEIKDYIKEHCSYKVPEIVQVDITNVSSSYLSWIERETQKL